jgi:DNA-binding NarL/FixJ family response regulator
MPDVVVIVVSDLMFQPRIEAAVRALGMEPRVADAPASAADATAAAPALVVVDLHERALDALAVVGRAHAAGSRVLAFGRHTEPATLRAARDAGADLAVPRSQFVEELAPLIESLVRPAPATDAG